MKSGARKYLYNDGVFFVSYVAPAGVLWNNSRIRRHQGPELMIKIGCKSRTQSNVSVGYILGIAFHNSPQVLFGSKQTCIHYVNLTKKCKQSTAYNQIL